MTASVAIPGDRSQWSSHDLNRVSDAVSELQASHVIVLRWDGVSDYTPTAAKAISDRPKEFRGPTDPNTVSGVVLNTYDVWMST